MPILYRYIIKELASPFMVILFVFTGLLFLTRSLKLIELITNKTASIWEVVYLFSLVVPQFLEMAIPMAFLLSIIMAISRLSADSEITVIRAAGVSLNKLLLPISAFSLIIFIISLIVSTWIRPASSLQLGLGLFKLATAQVSSRLVSGSFNEIGPLTIYSRETSNNGSILKDVIISDRRNPQTQRLFFAQNARFLTDESSRSVQMELFDGYMHDGTGSNISLTKYSTNSITISEEELASNNTELARKRTSEMSTKEIITNINEISLMPKPTRDEKLSFHLSRLRVELQKRFVLPTSCLCVCVLALALGIQPSRGGSKWGSTISFLSGIATILIYYISFAFTSAISESRGSEIELIMWIPNLIFFIIGIMLFRMIATERWTNVVDGIRNSFSNPSTTGMGQK